MHWHTVSDASEARLNIRRSRFIAYLVPAENPDAAAKIVSERSQEFADATHNCYAWLTGFEREHSYYADAGEPSGTAGKPILNALLSAGLTNVVAIVTRYYGGVKLGVRGLIEAYGQSVEAAISEAKIIAAIPMTELCINSDYADSEMILNLVQKLKGKVLETRYAQGVESVISLPKDALPQMQEFLDGRIHQSGLKYEIRE